MSNDPGEPEVIVERRGSLGVLVLNRPRAINALNHPMVRTMMAAIQAWQIDDSIRTILISGSGDRGLCAGGDLISMHRDAAEGTRDSVGFWRDEYDLDHAIATCPKDVVVLMDGIVLGGGVGISAHARHRVVTERTSVGMPEARIGFVPDVGGPWLLSRAPGELGTHLALTAGNADAADTIALGMADAFVPSALLPELEAALESEGPAPVLERLGQSVPPSGLVAARSWIDEAYAGDDALTIVRRLAASEIPAARQAAADIMARSPTAVTLTLGALRRARHLPDLRAALDQDLRVSTHLLDVPDMAEGIRAQVIDKDRSPRWSPATLAEVDVTAFESLFSSDGA